MLSGCCGDKGVGDGSFRSRRAFGITNRPALSMVAPTPAEYQRAGPVWVVHNSLTGAAESHSLISA